MKKKRRFNTISKKSTLLLSVIGIVIIAVIGMTFSDIFYAAMRPYFQNYIASAISSNAVRQSYVWRNSNLAYRFLFSDDLKNLISDYFKADENKSEVKKRIEERLPVARVGQFHSSENGEDGSITATSHTMVYTSSGEAFFSKDSSQIVPIVLRSDWLRELSNNEETTVYSPVISDDKTTTKVTCFAIRFEVDGMVCHAIHILNFNDIAAQFEELRALGITDYQFFQRGQLLYSSLGERSTISLEDYPPEMYSETQYRTMVRPRKDGIDFMILVSYEYEDYRMAVHVTKDTLLAPYQQIFRLFQAFLSGMVILLIVIVCVTLKWMLKRLTRLSKQMNLVREGNYNLTVFDSKEDEIGVLSQTFGIMLMRIKEDITHKVEQEKREQQMRYSLLVSAIDPHFIYNTLNTITFLSKMGRCDDIEVVNDALIAMLKDRLTMKSCKTFDSIRVEKEVLEQYVLIQSFLSQNKFHFAFEVSPEDLMLQIPKNILQPLVENSIQHGILCHKNEITREYIDGEIKISIQRSDNSIVIRLYDNGIGMDQDTIHRFFVKEPKPIDQNDAEHIGIHNVRSRLSYLYGERYSMTVESKVDEGTCITIRLPLE